MTNNLSKKTILIMKTSRKILLGLTLLCLYTNIKSQLYTGITTYSHNGTPARLSSGSIVDINTQGFLLGGYKPTTVLGDINLFIDKTWVDGSLVTGNTFQGAYQVYSGGSSCSSTFTQELNCHGLSVIEIPQSSSNTYVMAASFDSGFLFSTLDINGVTVNSNYFTFPSGANQISKPLIVQSLANNNFVFVSGSFDDAGTEYMYVLKIDLAANMSSSFIYDLGTSTRLSPSAMAISPYSSGPEELTIVGIANTNGDNDGFLMTVQDGSGSVLNMLMYDNGSGANDEILSLTVASNTNNSGNPGYVAGGYTDASPSLGRAWFLKIEPNGAIDWTNILGPVSGSANGAVVGIVERYSSFYADFEYHGVIQSSAGLEVLKVGSTGTWFSSAPKDFIYNDPSSPLTYAGAISYTDASTSNDGIHIFGTSNISGAEGDFMMVQAVFDGASANCASPSIQNITTNGAAVTAPTSTAVASVFNSGNPLGACSNFSINSNLTLSYTPKSICSSTVMPTTPVAGSNNRSSLPTNLNEHNSSSCNIFPTVASDIVFVQSSSAFLTDAEITLYSEIGLVVYKTSIDPEEKIISVNLSQQSISEGVYFLNVKSGGISHFKKIIYCTK